MYALFEDAGKFQAGRVLSAAEASSQIELESGKRIKVKATHILLTFDQPDPALLLSSALTLSQSIELDLAWEFSPDEEFGFDQLASVYFSERPSLEQRVAALLRLHEAPHYFRRAGKGRFRKAASDTVQQALAAIEKKRLLQLQIQDWAAALVRGECPGPIREQLFKILFKPDKNAPEYKAVVEAARTSHTAPLALLQKAGAIDSPYQFHWQRFLFENFPKGYAFPPLEAPDIVEDLALASAQAFSIDDSATTEIDDALSVQGLGQGVVMVGIHIAAPGLAVQRGDRIDAVARARLSTVYMPGLKSPCCPMRWCGATPCRKDGTARRSRCMWRWMKPRWKYARTKLGWSASGSSTTCAMTCWTRWSHRSGCMPANRPRALRRTRSWIPACTQGWLFCIAGPNT